MSVLSEIISAEGSSPVSGTEEMPCEWKSAWFLTATESWHYSFKKYLLSIYCALEWWKERQDSSGACPHEGYNRKKRKRLFSIAFYMPAPRVKLLLIREGIERITLWICHDVVPLCNKSSSARGYGFLVSTPPFVVMPCLFFTSFQSNSCEREPTTFIHLSHKCVLPTCLPSAPSSIWVQSESTDQIKNCADQGKVLFRQQDW